MKKFKSAILAIISVCLAIGAAYAAKLCVGTPWIKSIALSGGVESINIGSNTSWTATVGTDYPANSNKAITWEVYNVDGTSCSPNCAASVTNQSATNATTGIATATINGIRVGSNATGAAKIRAVANDGSGVHDERDIAVSCPTSGVSPAGGTFSADSPFNASTACRYTAPNKTISGCYSVQTNRVSYSGSAWPASTYTVTANAGYYVQNNGSASATCVSCSNGCSTWQSCSSQSCSVANGSCSYTDSYQTQSAACTNGAGNTSTSASCAGWSGCGGGSVKSVSCNNGYTPQNNNTTSASCVVAFTIHSNLTGVCSSLSSTSKFPYTICGGRTPTTPNSSTAWTGTSCALPSSTGTIYGNIRCSSTSGTMGNTIANPSTSGTTNRCWCQLCSSSTKTSCGAWAFCVTNASAAACAEQCSSYCGDYVGRYDDRSFRSALCAAP